ncbi:hypothetical protein HX049_05140 [Myroides odoratimimus]|uniref:hypothetical protein n=1 Tax=Myroides odoratimimus TaxID=76832 RepID=UPI00257915DE|nr:hypothetical protein [Myroides odoratimimus]MDM1396554.1 hypothetical protein [Myroides odoratimimus]
MNVTEVKPIVNQNYIDSAVEKLEAGASYFQEFVDDFNQMDIGTMEGNDLQALFNNPKEFVSKKLTGDQPIEISGRKIQIDKYYELLEKPQAMDDFIERVLEHSTRNNPNREYNTEKYLIKENVVVIIDKEIERITEFNTLYFNTDEEKRLYLSLEMICEGINNFKAVTKGPFNLDNISNDEMLKRGKWKKGDLHSEYVDFEINVDYLKRQMRILRNRN